ncbi:MAG: polyprenyl synthetase family protein [Eubacterium ramulus]
MQETYRLFGGSSDIIEPFMAAIEMIHTYSLIHDDLPAMDNDDYRRGRKTTHVVYGEAMGILAGDALLNFAFETACKGLMQDVGNPAVARADSDPGAESRYLWHAGRSGGRCGIGGTTAGAGKTGFYLRFEKQVHLSKLPC